MGSCVYAVAPLLSFLLLFLQFANQVCVHARKDGGEYWHGTDAELVQAGLVQVSKVTSAVPHKNSDDCHLDDDVKSRHRKTFAEGFQPRPNGDRKSFDKDFEPRPNVSAYTDEVKPDAEKSFDKDFEPRPNVSAYTDEVKPDGEKSFDKDFESRPNVSVYGDDATMEKAVDAVEKDLENGKNQS